MNLVQVLINGYEMHVKTTSDEAVYDLRQFGFEAEQPIQEGKNHLFKEGLIKSVKAFSRKHLPIWKRMLTKDHVVIGLTTVDKMAQRHFEDWACVIGRNGPKVTIVSGLDFDRTPTSKIFSRLLNTQYYNLVSTKEF